MSLWEGVLVVVGDAEVEEAFDAEAEAETDDAGGKTRSSTSQTDCQHFICTSPSEAT
jgi:hypothetical protein